MKLLLTLLLPLLAQATIWNLLTNDYVGLITLENSDILIVHPNNSILTRPRFNQHTTIVLCSTFECREQAIVKYKRLHRTYGITVCTVE